MRCSGVTQNQPPVLQTYRYTNAPAALGIVHFACDDRYLYRLWLQGQTIHAPHQDFRMVLSNHGLSSGQSIASQVSDWLDAYFHDPRTMRACALPPMCLIGTPFQLSVWRLLTEIPVGETTTYGTIAARIAQENGLRRMSAQAVGNAVGSNPIAILLPCHRVLGKDGALTGYAGGLDYKIALLRAEGAHFSTHG